MTVAALEIRTTMRSTLSLQQEIEEGLWRYYTAYYHECLGLPDWKRRVERRLQEEAVFGEPVIRNIERWIGYQFGGKRVLVVGAGTGAECVTLARRQAVVFGVEPHEHALQILHLKARLHGLDRGAFLAGVAEHLPFRDESFDFVYCYTVLEHVQDVGQSLDEMVRVCRPTGYIFIQTPDYRFPYEGHYKLPLLPLAPRWLQAVSLRVRGRPTKFLRSVNFLTGPQLDRLFAQRRLLAMRVVEPHVPLWHVNGQRWWAWLSTTFSIPKHQTVFLQRTDGQGTAVER